jgi:hypothetical protein
MGSAVYWPAECLRRVQLIVSTRKSKNISIQRASRFLTAKGYPPTQPRLVREALSSLVFDLEQDSNKQRPFLPSADYDMPEKRRRLVRGLKKKHQGVTEPARTALSEYAAAIVGLAGGTDDDPLLIAVAQIMSVPAVREALNGIDEMALMAAYAEGTAWFDYLSPFLFHMIQALSTSSGVASDASLGNVTLDESSPFARWLDTDVSIGFLDSLRMYGVLLAIAFRHAERHSPEVFSGLLAQLQRVRMIFGSLGLAAEMDAVVNAVEHEEGERRAE